MPASTVTEYLAALPADRREALNEVRRGINRALPPGYKGKTKRGQSVNLGSCLRDRDWSATYPWRRLRIGTAIG